MKARFDARRRTMAAAGVAALFVAGTLVPVGAASRSSPPARVDRRVLAAVERVGEAATLDLVVSLDRPAGRGLRRALDRLGVWSWAFDHVPAAGVRLPVGRLGALRRLDGVRGVYLDSKLDYYLKDSAGLMNTGRAWNDLKVTGKGVTVAILDSGVDFTHPDLAPAMKANVKLLEYGSPTPVIPIEGIPNSDWTSGHGTHVAGDVAGRGTQSGGDFKGMAYGADLVGIGAGDVLFIFTVLEGFDYVIEHKDDYNIRAVNNSWGTEFEPFDPNHPINLATKAVHDAGVVVLFAMGNSYDELTMNPYAAAPWVIPVAAGTKTATVTDFSSGGIEADLPGLTFDGRSIVGDARAANQMSFYHPSVTATGENVISTRANNTVLPLLGIQADLSNFSDSPERLLRYTTMSGTSMATPETAGVVALILEADPALTPDQVRRVLEVTAKPIKDVPFWKQGYGHVDASAAVDLALELARSTRTMAAAAAGSAVQSTLSSRHGARDAAVLGGLKRPKRSAAFVDDAPVGLPLSIEHTIDVPAGTDRVKAVTNGPIALLVNLASYDLHLTDAAGSEVGSNAPVFPPQNISSGTTTLDLDLHALSEDAAEAAKRYDALNWGSWTVRIESILPQGTPAKDLPIEDLPKPSIHTVVSLFDNPAPACGPVEIFVPLKPVTYRFQDDEASGVSFPANPSYTYVGLAEGGSLGTRTPPRNLAGDFGYANTYGDATPVRFATPPLEKPLTIGTGATLNVWVQGRPSEIPSGQLTGQVLDFGPGDEVTAVSTLPETYMEAGVDAPKLTTIQTLITKPYTLAAGHRLAVDMNVSGGVTAANTLFYDSDEFPSGLTVVPGRVVTKQAACPGAAPAQVRGAKRTRPRPAALPATGVGGGPVAFLGVAVWVVAALTARRLRRG